MAVKFLVSIHGAVIIELHTRIAGAFALVHCRQALDLKALHAAEYTQGQHLHFINACGAPNTIYSTATAAIVYATRKCTCLSAATQWSCGVKLV